MAVVGIVTDSLSGAKMTSQNRSSRDRSSSGGESSRSARGFTLIEVLIVVTLMIILAGFAFRAFGDTVVQWAVKGAANEFVSRHELARATAIQFGRTGRLEVDTAAGRLWVEVDTTFLLTGARDTIGSIAELSGDGVGITTSRTSFCFGGRGVPTSAGTGCSASAATVIFSKGAAAETLTVSVLGKVIR